MTPQQLSSWKSYVERVSGFVLPTAQHDWLRFAVGSTATQLGLTHDQLLASLEKDEAATQLLFDNLLIAESRFFRHEPSLNYIGKLFQDKFEQLGGSHVGNGFGVWSVGCSTGQEVYSIAMKLQQVADTNSLPDTYTVTGSDLGMRSLAVAKVGEYNQRQVNEIPKRYHQFLSFVGEHKTALSNKEVWKIREDIAEKTQFLHHNVFSQTQLEIPKQDVIICQNVLIYFRKFDQRDILAYFVKNLELGGSIILAPNEAIFWQHPKMKKVEDSFINAWKKIAV